MREYVGQRAASGANKYPDIIHTKSPILAKNNFFSSVMVIPSLLQKVQFMKETF